MAAQAQPISVLYQRYDGDRLGYNPQERALNVANICGGHFGLQFICPVLDQLYAQPLLVPGVPISGHLNNMRVEVSDQKIYIAPTAFAVGLSSLTAKILAARDY